MAKPPAKNAKPKPRKPKVRVPSPAEVQAMGKHPHPGLPGEAKPTDAELIDRRMVVLKLRYHQRLSVAQVAAKLDVSVPTIERDITWWREQWKARFGTTTPSFDPAEKIGESLALFERLETRAFEELMRLDADPFLAIHAQLETLSAEVPPDVQLAALETARLALAGAANRERGLAYQRSRLIYTIAAMREKQVAFLQDLGLLDRKLGSLELPEALAQRLAALPTGDRIAALLQQSGGPLKPDALVPSGERLH